MDVRRLIHPLGTSIVVLAATFSLSSCKSDNAIRSPNLPPPQLNSLAASCSNTNLIVGQTTQCNAACTYSQVNENGQVIITAPGTCDGLSWSSNDACVDIHPATGFVTAVCPTTTADVTASVDGGITSVPITVTAATVTCSIVYQKGAIPDPQPDASCAGATDFAASAPVGVTVPFRAAVRLNNGQLCYAPDAPANAQPCPAGLVSFASSNVGVAQFPAPANGLATTVTLGTTNVTATGSVNRVVLTVTQAQLAAQLCVESLPPTVGCVAYTQATVQCAADQIPDIPTGTSFQFRARAFFDVGTSVGQVCDVTTNASTNWSISSVGSNAAANPTVNNSNAKGNVSGGNQPTAGATVSATYTDASGTATGSHPFNVVVGLVIARNSLFASTAIVSNDPNNPAFAQTEEATCIAALISPMQARLYGVLRRCPSSAVGPDGNCDPAQFSNVLEDVTNAEPPNNARQAQIVWQAAEGFWDGLQCSTSIPPLGQLVGVLLPQPGRVGDNDAGARYAVGAAFSGNGDARVFVPGQMEDNGVAAGASALSIGSVCVTATYTEGSAMARDGVTVIVFPLIVDPPLCDVLRPLFDN